MSFEMHLSSRQSTENHHPYLRPAATATPIYYNPHYAQPSNLPPLLPLPSAETYFQPFLPPIPILHSSSTLSDAMLLPGDFDLSRQPVMDPLVHTRNSRPLMPFSGFPGPLQQHSSPAHCQLPEKSLPTQHDFDQLLYDYIYSLSPKKRDKALIPQRRYDSILAVLKDPKCTTIESAQFRFWAKKMFRIGVVESAQVVLHEGKPVAVKESLFGILTTSHIQAQHGGRDKTSLQVRKYWSWVPKELIARFVRSCPSCNQRRQPPLSLNTRRDSYCSSPGSSGRTVTPPMGMQSPVVYKNSSNDSGAGTNGFFSQPLQIVAQSGGSGGGGGLLYSTAATSQHPNHMIQCSWLQ